MWACSRTAESYTVFTAFARENLPTKQMPPWMTGSAVDAVSSKPCGRCWRPASIMLAARPPGHRAHRLKVLKFSLKTKWTYQGSGWSLSYINMNSLLLCGPSNISIKNQTETSRDIANSEVFIFQILPDPVPLVSVLLPAAFCELQLVFFPGSGVPPTATYRCATSDDKRR